MTKKSLSSEFRDPDKTDRLDELIQYLENFDSLPETQVFKEHSYQYLGLQKGNIVLDAGCGPGYDSLRMAERVGSSGHVTGIDISTGMVARAQEKAAGSGLPVTFRTGNICDLDLPDNSFDSVRVERTLQLVTDTGRGIDELIRVLRPGGTLVAVDPDWETFVVDPGNRDTTRKFFRFCADQFPDGSSGRKFYRYFRERNLSDVVIHPEPLVFHDFSLTYRILNMDQFLAAAVEQSELSRGEVEAWVQELKSSDTAGNFTFTGVMFAVSGRK
jgi:ubiquinone/menaquinone biosynthesis C-methylase UbiE